MEQTRFHGAWDGGDGKSSRRAGDLQRIEAALQAAETVCKSFTAETVRVDRKAGGEPVTAVDRAVNELLLQMLPRGDEGWLSEESADDARRLDKRRVWIVDPLDGTKEFLAGLPEWCISIALAEDGQAVAGGICNPITGETFVGSRETGIRHWPSDTQDTLSVEREKPVVLASRSETRRGEWDWVKDAPFAVRSVGSVAYKLALVAAGRADATWTLVPKSEWDVAAGVALVQSSGGTVRGLNGRPIAFNQPETRWQGLVAFSALAQGRLAQLFEEWLSRRR